MLNALIVGIHGQDGAYLSRFLLNQGYNVQGIARRTSNPNDWRLKELRLDVPISYGDILDQSFLQRVLNDGFGEVYNLAAQSDVAVSFAAPDYTIQVNTLGTLRLLEAVLQVNRDTKVYQASTSEMFGSSSPPQNEETVMAPRSPYAAAKLAAYHLVRQYRDAYGMFVVNGILFNHESPLRGTEFVTRKVAKAVAEFASGTRHQALILGNLDASRDWGHVSDYVRGMWMMMQAPDPQDYVLATGETRTVRELVETAFRIAGMPIHWTQPGVGIRISDNRVMVLSVPELHRPLEVHCLQGDASRACRELGWMPEISFEQMIGEMIDVESRRLRD